MATIDTILTLQVGGIPLPTPSQYQVDFEDVDKDSKRNLKDATMKRNVIRKNVAKITINWDLMTVEKCNELMTILSKEKETISVTFYDVRIGKINTIRMYVAKLNYKYVRANNTIKCQSASTSLTEV